MCVCVCVCEGGGGGNTALSDAVFWRMCVTKQNNYFRQNIYEDFYSKLFPIGQETFLKNPLSSEMFIRATLVNSSFLVPTNPKNRVGRSEIKKKIVLGQKELIIIALQI